MVGGGGGDRCGMAGWEAVARLRGGVIRPAARLTRPEVVVPNIQLIYAFCAPEAVVFAVTVSSQRVVCSEAISWVHFRRLGRECRTRSGVESLSGGQDDHRNAEFSSSGGVLLVLADALEDRVRDLPHCVTMRPVA